MLHKAKQDELVMKALNKQRGLALLVLVVFLALIAITYAAKSLDSVAIENERDKKTHAVLAEAKIALIGYLVGNASKPGTLPCPDVTNDGSADTSGTNACTGYIGRLPAKQLGLSMLEDADGECLWYAISPVFRNQMTAVNRALNPINGVNLGTIGTITLRDDAGNALSGSVNPVIAVVVSPGSPVSGQSRSGAVTTYCSGDSFASKYLDVKGVVNNSTGNVAGNNYTFILGKQDNIFNDRFIYIRASDIYSTLRKRMAKEIMGNLDVPSGLFKYYQTAATLNTYPYPAKIVTGNADSSLPLGNNIPYNDSVNPLQYTALGNWLINNGWFPIATYNYYSATHVAVTLIDSYGSYTCDANMNVVSCN